MCAVPGFGETNERLIYVDERAMRLGYSGTMRGAPFVTEAVNHWSVLPGGANASIVYICPTRSSNAGNSSRGEFPPWQSGKN